jgi:RNA polymerase sigma-70 factor (ECF subfamily)
LDSPAADRASPRFATTRWSLVVSAAGRADDATARGALASLCQAYWYPLYAYLRRQGTPAAEAEDLVQAFFAELLAKDRLAVADRERGKFRSFLLVSLKHFQANEHRREGAQKRGGDCEIVSLDLAGGQQRYALEPAHDLTAERIFERSWALALLDQSLAAMRAEFVGAGKLALFERLKEHLGGDRAAVPYRELAGELGLTEGALKVAVHRFRQRWREVLREQIAQTVAGPDDGDDELRDLCEAVSD